MPARATTAMKTATQVPIVPARPTGSDMLDMLKMGDLIFMINEKTLMLMRTWHSRDVNEVSRAPDNFDLICCRATKPPR